MYNRYNTELSVGDSGSANNLRLIRPVICFLSQYDRKSMINFITPSEKADCYLEKPLPIQELQALMKLLNIGTENARQI